MHDRVPRGKACRNLRANPRLRQSQESASNSGQAVKSPLKKGAKAAGLGGCPGIFAPRMYDNPRAVSANRCPPLLRGTLTALRTNQAIRSLKPKCAGAVIKDQRPDRARLSSATPPGGVRQLCGRIATWRGGRQEPSVELTLDALESCRKILNLRLTGSLNH